MISYRHLPATLKRTVRRLLRIGENRLELLTVEVQEERMHLLHTFLLALGMAVFGLLAALTLSAAIVIMFWAYSPVIVLLILTGLHAAAGAWLARLLAGRLRDWQILPATLDQLRKDRACLETILE
ncbi:MAG TPA: phage holin family protein [Verrucomicrobiae bacterium]|nr:phage holin family protein [Verrucomicrobiae bacterium]